mmetsp:Transcript_890/g.2640  ORF Transcript_890/g.2640 Transcript_890/m.2640 type:complete len:242 (+) Transcript_890:1086-1811(+)
MTKNCCKGASSSFPSEGALVAVIQVLQRQSPLDCESGLDQLLVRGVDLLLFGPRVVVRDAEVLELVPLSPTCALLLLRQVAGTPPPGLLYLLPGQGLHLDRVYVLHHVLKVGILLPVPVLVEHPPGYEPVHASLLPARDLGHEECRNAHPKDPHDSGVHLGPGPQATRLRLGQGLRLRPSLPPLSPRPRHNTVSPPSALPPSQPTPSHHSSPHHSSPLHSSPRSSSLRARLCAEERARVVP